MLAPLALQLPQLASVRALYQRALLALVQVLVQALLVSAQALVLASVQAKVHLALRLPYGVVRIAKAL